MEEKAMSIGQKLRVMREKKGVSQAEAGEVIHVSRQCYQSYESETREPNRQNILKLAEYYGVPIGILMDDNVALVGATKENPVYGRRKGDDNLLLNLAHDMTYDEYWEFYEYGRKILGRRYGMQKDKRMNNKAENNQ